MKDAQPLHSEQALTDALNKAAATKHWEGEPHRECGEHRTTGQRAWCFSCSEWCYPNLPCRGCEIPKMRAALEWIAHFDDAHMETARTLHHDMRGAARKALGRDAITNQ